jgi:hypothetical protein
MDMSDLLNTAVDEFDEAAVFPAESTSADAEPRSDDPIAELAEFRPESERVAPGRRDNRSVPAPLT